MKHYSSLNNIMDNKERLLVIDDDEEIRSLFTTVLRKEGYKVFSADCGKKGIEIFKEKETDMVLLDLQMPEMDGFEVLSLLQKENSHIPVIIVTGHGTVTNAVKSLKEGAADFIVKPFEMQELLQAVRRNLKVKKLTREISKLRMVETTLQLNKTIVSLTGLDELLKKVIMIIDNLLSPDSIAVYLLDRKRQNFNIKAEKFRGNYKRKLLKSYRLDEMNEIFRNGKALVKNNGNSTVTVPIAGKEKKTGVIQIDFPKERVIKEEDIIFLESFAMQLGIGIENANLFEQVHFSYINAVKSLVNSLEARDPYTKGHSDQVTAYALILGEKMGLSEEDLEILKDASSLHDLGKLGIEDKILLKPSALDEKEIKIIRKHPEITVKILKPLNISKEAVEACLYHHERVDGKGYPNGLKGEEIPIFARILSVADAYSAMTSDRPYRSRLSTMKAISELKRCSGTQFDRRVVETCAEVLEEREVKK
jgi:response regulator RpfG family c-di-GMP phosphodiesterase